MKHIEVEEVNKDINVLDDFFRVTIGENELFIMHQTNEVVLRDNKNKSHIVIPFSDMSSIINYCKYFNTGGF